MYKTCLLQCCFRRTTDREKIWFCVVSCGINRSTESSFCCENSAAGDSVKAEQSFVFWGLCPKYRSVAVVGLGKRGQGYDEAEDIDEGSESVRIAAHVGCNSLKSLGMTHVDIDEMENPESVAEGATLSNWVFDQFKTKDRKPALNISPFLRGSNGAWERGVLKASAQNLARRLMDTPANLMTPTAFARNASEALEPHGVSVVARDAAWAESMRMGGFLSVGRGSVEPPVFLEATYRGAPDARAAVRPIVLVGKGVTFDSGGISMKPAANMDLMRADMGGAACVVAALSAVAQLGLPVDVVALVPLCENLASGAATKPGDVITMMDGKTVCVDNTDAEGRLILADALCYGARLAPRFMLDIATLTGAMSVAVGTGATGVFTGSDALWERLRAAGAETGDRVWRFPLWKHYARQVTDYPAFDLNNIGKGKGGGACTAAAFLRQFVPDGVDWMHLDMAGVMGPSDDIKYLPKGMTGRPTRTLIQFVEKMSKCT